MRGRDHPWVSRGGLKPAHRIERFGVDPAGRVCLDIGASTGGFTDVLLDRGAAKVYAVDVGHGQLAWKLRTDARVVVPEKTNALHLTHGLVPDPLGAVVCDASFIGLETVLPAGGPPVSAQARSHASSQRRTSMPLVFSIVAQRGRQPGAAGATRHAQRLDAPDGFVAMAHRGRFLVRVDRLVERLEQRQEPWNAVGHPPAYWTSGDAVGPPAQPPTP